MKVTQRRHFEATADRGDGKKTRIKMIVVGNIIQLREHYKHRRFTIPLEDAVGVLFRQAQVREARMRMGG
jgi:hypothetical protein